MKQANGTVFINGKQVNAFIQAKTKKRMLEMINENMNHLNTHWSHIWNDGMKAVGGDEEGLWVAPNTGDLDEYEKFKRLK